VQIDKSVFVNLGLTTVGRGEAPVDLKDLIRAVQDKTRSCSELERLDVAVQYGELLRGMGDDLVGHFVDQARTAGASWSQVGERLGVTRQAAHQRHVHRTSRLFGHRSRSPGQGPFQRFTQEAKDVIVAAQEEARSFRHNYVGVEHLLLGLSADGVVGPLVDAAGASREAILEQIRRIVGDGKETPDGTIPFTPRSKRALELGVRAAGRSSQPIRPAHILLGILDLREGVGAEILDRLDVARNDLRRAAKAALPGEN
jgi:Clp amino terminal domain, pathogenicity island component